MMLGMFGLSAELTGQQLIPIGTVYDPFVLRGLDALGLWAVLGITLYFCRHALGHHACS